jgi:hypothetical protein
VKFDKLPDEPTPWQRLIAITIDKSDDELRIMRREAGEARVEGELDTTSLITLIDIILADRESFYQDIGWRPGDPPLTDEQITDYMHRTRRK